MARDYAKISTSLWNSRKFRGLPDDDCRLLYLYLHTCPHVNSVGCFVLPEGYALTDLGWTSEAYRKAMDSLSQAYLVGFDRGENVVRIVDYLQHDPFTNPKHAAGAIKIASMLPACEQKELLFNDLMADRYAAPSFENAKPTDSLSKAYRNPEPEPEPEPLRDLEPNGPKSQRATQRKPDAKKTSDDEPLRILIAIAGQQAAADFIAHRKAKRAPLTARAAELIVAKLAGHPDPAAVLAASIMNGWTGVFPDGATGPPRAQHKPFDTDAAFARAFPEMKLEPPQ